MIMRFCVYRDLIRFAVLLALCAALAACSTCQAGKTVCGGAYPLIEL